MGKIGFIIGREYFTRVRKRSFIIMTILGPLLIAGMYAALIALAVSEGTAEHRVMVVDKSKLKLGDELKKFNKKYPNANLQFVWRYNNLQTAKDSLSTDDYNSVLYISENPVNKPSTIVLFYDDRPANSTKATINNQLEKILLKIKLKKYNITMQDYAILDNPLSINMLKYDGEQAIKDAGGLAYVVGLIASLLIYFFIFLYGVQVLRGVMEEKTNRIVEIIISSVRPFQLMMGKIIGIALVGLTQFLIWVVFTFIVISAVGLAFAPGVMEQVQTGAVHTQQEVAGISVGGILESFSRINFLLVIGTFIFYFLGGYLLYSALFAAVGAVVDSETDTQQFMLPVTLPLIFSIGIGQVVLNNPTGSFAVIFSLIPVTSPIIMMTRIPFGIHFWELIASMLCLIGGFIFTTWLAGRLYRIGILMYGKKVTYRELWKWLFYK